MKIIFVSQGSYGDVLPVLAVAKQISKLGYNVELVAYSVFTTLVERENIEFLGVCTPEQYQDMVSCNTDLTDREYCYHHFSTCSQYAIEPIYNRIAHVHRNEGCIVVASLICDGALWACQDFSIPIIRTSLSPQELINEIELENKKNAEGYKVDIKPPSRELEIINKVRFRLGLSLFENDDSRCVPEYRKTLCLFPESLVNSPSMVDALYRRGSFFSGFIESEQKIQHEPVNLRNADIVYTCGSAFSATNAEFESFLQLCEALDVSGLFVSNNTTLNVSCVSSRVEIVRSLDMRQALKHASLIIHHGGIGTIADAIFGMCPQIIMPRAFDQFSNADMVESLGIGKKVDLSQFKNLSGVVVVARQLIADKKSIKNRIKALKLHVNNKSELAMVIKCIIDSVVGEPAVELEC